MIPLPGWLAGLGARVLAIGGAILGVFIAIAAIFYRGKAAGTEQARVHSIEADNQNRRTRDEIDQSVAVVPGDAIADELQQWGKRD